MTYKIIILPLAKNDILESATWYKSKQKDLGVKFVKSIRNELKYIRKHPFSTVNRYKNIHTCVNSTFPFMIHYYIENESIIITAVLR
jgi:hypothetical protein